MIYLKKIIICVLVFYTAAYSMEESETKHHMQACFDAMQEKNYKKFETLMKQDKFYLYHLHDSFKEKPSAVSFYQVLSNYLFEWEHNPNPGHNQSIKEMLAEHNSILSFEHLLKALEADYIQNHSRVK